MSVESLYKGYRALDAQASPVRNIHDEIDTYIAPLQRRDTKGDEDPATTDPAIWDFTAVDGSEKLAATIQGGATPSTIRWAKTTFKDVNLDQDHEAKKYAEACEDALFKAIEYSGFYVETGAFFQELIDHGQGFLSVEGDWSGDVETAETFNGLRFAAVPCREMLFEEDSTGGLKKAFWTRSWKASQIVDFCQRRDWTVPERAQSAFDRSENLRFDFVFAVFERPEILAEKRKGKKGDFIYPAIPGKRPYGTRYFLGETGEPVGEEGGLWHMPFQTVAWERKAGSSWGYGPGHVALPTVKYVNKTLEMIREAQHRAIVPAFLATQQALLGDMNVYPGGVTFCTDPKAITPLLVGDMAVSVDLINDLRGQIRQLYRVDDLQLKDSPAMTATEVLARVDYMNRMYGSTLARIWEFLSRVLQFAMEILERAGLLPEAPESVSSAGGIYTFEFLGPLARSQRTDEVAALERWANQTVGLSQVFPEARYIIDYHELLREAALKLGIPAKCIRAPGDVKRLVEEEKAAALRAQQVEQAKANAESLARLATIPGAMQAPGSAGSPGAVPGGMAFPGAVELAPSGVPG